MLAEHVQAMKTLVQGVMTSNLGLIQGDKIPPELIRPFDGFLKVCNNTKKIQIKITKTSHQALRQQSILQIMRTLGVETMPFWLTLGQGRYPTLQDYQIATQEECVTYWNAFLPPDPSDVVMSSSFDKLSLASSMLVQPTQNGMHKITLVCAKVHNCFSIYFVFFI